MEVKEYKSYEEMSAEDKAKYFGNTASGMINWCLMDRARVKVLIGWALAQRGTAEEKNYAQLKEEITEAINDIKR